jgi:hypothetical protein
MYVASGVAREYCDSLSRDGHLAGTTISLDSTDLGTETCFDPSLNHLHVNITTERFLFNNRLGQQNVLRKISLSFSE